MRRFYVFLYIASVLITSSVSSQAPRWELIDFPDRPVIAPGFQAPWDSEGVGDPELIWDGTYFRLYYTGFGADGISRILLAYSTTLVDWLPAGVVLQPGNSGFDQDGVADPDIVKMNGQFRMFYTATTNQWKQIAWTESPNGVIFNNDRHLALTASFNNERFDFIGVGEPSAVFHQGQIQMLYRGFDGSNWYRMGLALSTDGDTFIRIAGEDEFGSNFGLGPHGFDDGGATEPEVWVNDNDEIRLLYTSLHY